MADTSFRLELKTEQTQRAFRRLKDRAPYLIARALNRSAASACTLMIRVISQDTGIKQADLKGTTKRNRAVWVREANPGKLSATVYAAAERIPLMDFRAKGPMPSRGRGRGVSAGPRGGVKRYRDLFIVELQSGHIGVFGRIGTAARESRGAWGPNLPIHEKHGPSIAHVWNAHAAEGVARANEQLIKNLRHEFKFALQQQQGA